MQSLSSRPDKTILFIVARKCNVHMFRHGQRYDMSHGTAIVPVNVHANPQTYTCSVMQPQPRLNCRCHSFTVWINPADPFLSCSLWRDVSDCSYNLFIYIIYICFMETTCSTFRKVLRAIILTPNVTGC